MSYMDNQEIIKNHANKICNILQIIKTEKVQHGKRK